MAGGCTRRIAIGTAGIILPLRDPVAVAKQASSVDHLSEGRFILGLSTGDRPSEYPAFGMNFENRAERFRDARKVVQELLTQSFAVHRSIFYGDLTGDLDLVPKPKQSQLPYIAVGRCGQEIEWLAQHMDGWIWHQSNF